MTITLCGSTKYKKEFEDANMWLTIWGYVVLSVGSFHHSEPDPKIRDTIMANKERLDKLHFHKIDMSEAILVIDVNNYIGESTKNEIAYAVKQGLGVYSYTESKEYNEQLTNLMASYELETLVKQLQNRQI